MSGKNFMSFGDADTILTEFSNDIKSRVSTKANQGLTAQQQANAKTNIGIENVPNVATNDQTPTFLEESTRTNIASGDKLSLIFGKIKKFFSDLKAVAFSGSYNDLSDTPDLSLKADKTDIDSVYSVMGQNGAKNLIPYPYNETTQVDHGVTFTVNNDGTVIANGTANGTAQLYLVLGNVSLSAAGNLVINTNKPLFLSGCPSGGGNTTYRIQYSLTDGTTYWAKTASDRGSGVKITPVAGLNSYCFDVIKIMVFDGYTVNNLTFKPMLRLAADTDSAYQPYAETNKQLTDGKAKLESVRDYVNELGVKNLIPYPYYESSYTQNGITWTVNADGTITADGTATANEQFHVNEQLLGVVKEGTSLIITGCPSGGGSGKYWLYVDKYVSSYSTVVSEYGEGRKFVMPSDASRVRILAVIASGATVSNLTFKPMLRLASDINDDTYVQYAMTNKQLTDKLEKCWKLDAGTVIPDNSNLNDYKTPGNYYHLTTNVSTISNIPDNKGFRLTVLLDLYDPAYVEQIFNPIGSYKTYKRYYSTSNTWTDWKVVEDDLSGKANTSDIPSALSQLTDDSTHRVVTDTEKTTWNDKAGQTTVTIPVFTPSQAGWRRICKIKATGGATVEGTIYVGGNWTNGQPVSALLSVNIIHTWASLTLLSNNSGSGLIKSIRLVYSGSSNQFWVDVYFPAYSAGTGPHRLIFTGDIVVSDIQNPISITTDTTAASEISLAQTVSGVVVTNDPIKIRSLTIDVPAVSAGRGTVVYKAFPVISGYKAVGIIGMSCLGNMGTLSLNDFFVNNTEAYVSYNNNTSSATTASAVTVDILYMKT